MSIQPMYAAGSFSDAVERAQTAVAGAFLKVVVAEQHLPPITCSASCPIPTRFRGCLEVEVEARATIAALGVFLREVDSACLILQMSAETSQLHPVEGELASMSAVGHLQHLSEVVFLGKVQLDQASRLLEVAHPKAAALYAQIAGVLSDALLAVVELLAAAKP